ncbi:MAG TPA: hypothetical protein VH079_10030 [Terriglobales bacterium]|jgi:hypothetical protein|nr:hypothetical protein [Terriglobales bacterium]
MKTKSQAKSKFTATQEASISQIMSERGIGRKSAIKAMTRLSRQLRTPTIAAP